MPYRAKTRGFIPGPRGPIEIEQGQVFELPAGIKPGRWMEQVGPPSAPKAEPPKSDPKRN